MEFETLFNFAGGQDEFSARKSKDFSAEQSCYSELIQELMNIKAIFDESRFEDAYGRLVGIKGEIEVFSDRLGFEERLIIADIYRSKSDFPNTEKWYQRAAELNPDNCQFWLCFASLYLDWGRCEKAFDIYEQKLDFVDDKINFMSVYLFNRHYDYTVKREELFSRHREWGRLVSKQIKPFNVDFSLKSSGKIRIGYVSGDYGRHSVAFFIRSLLRCHDRRKFEVFGYGNVRNTDYVTEKLGAYFDVYRDIYRLSDEKAADLILKDKIDILVDLNGHTEGNRLTMFALRPAPLQVSYLGYPNTTGLNTMDYRITDRLCEIEGSEKYHSEELVYLPGGFLCYEPFGGFPDVDGLAAKKNGYITFGSFNNIRKLNSYIIGLWSKVLSSVAGSRIILKVRGGDSKHVRKIYLEMFARCGIESGRIEFCPQLQDDRSHLEMYNKIDIALDTYPYNGTTTTCEAMLMGVPVVSLAGEHHMSRVGLSLLEKVGLGFFAAKTGDEFVRKAAALSRDSESLSKIRASMRDRMFKSGLCDAQEFTGKVEKAFEKLVEDKLTETAGNASGNGKELPEINRIVEEIRLAFPHNRRGAYDLIKRYEKEIESVSDHLPFGVMNLLAETYRSQLDFVFAERWYDRAAALGTDDFLFWLNFASFYLVTGRFERSFDLYKQKLSEVDNKLEYLSIYLYMLHYNPYVTRDERFELHKKWGRLVPEKVEPRDIEYCLKSSGKIRVGYVSADFKRHSVAFYIASLLDNHDRKKFEVYGYSDVREADFVTERLAGAMDFYRDISKMSDEEVFDMIAEDKIDILVDLSGHTGSNRLLVFAQKPAPIQVTYLGYPNTTGLSTMDYRITDRIAESQDSADYHTERLAYLPNSFLCYKTFDNMPEIGELAAKRNGFVTFGSFNNIRKLNPYLISLWSEILLSVENSRMILKIEGGNKDFVKESYSRIFAENGVNPDRLKFYGYLPDLEHFDLYNQIDIGLDTYPYNGTTTTCEALWMGVPVVSLIGEEHVSRVGASLLNKVGLEYFAAKNSKEYILKAAALAGNIDSLAKIRSSMRQRVVSSGLCDGAGFSRDVENLYENMIAEWKPKEKTFLLFEY